MDIASIYETLINDLQNIGWQEWVSTLAQIASVLYAQRNNILVYPTGILGVLLAAWVYFFIAAPPLYAEGYLHLYYCGISMYGWYNWRIKRGDTTEYYPISWCNSKERAIGLIMFLGTWLVISFVLNHYTDSNTPYLDAIVSSSAITAMWWMTKRKIDNWLAWIFSNIFAIPLNFYKGFMLFTLMYALFLVLAYNGYKSWIKMKYLSQTSKENLT